MKIRIYKDEYKLGAAAARHAAAVVRKAIKKDGYCRIVLSTGASQFTFFDAFVRQKIDWSKVEMFHLDEYVGVSDKHKASFCAYLKQRFISRVGTLKAAHLIDGLAEPSLTIERLSAEIRGGPIHLGLIGIGENAHIAFNDPPADFGDESAFKVVNLDEDCKRQQVREGWFESVETVCKQAITMTCRQIAECRTIISVVPFAVKAQAIKKTIQSKDINPAIPATFLKKHGDFNLYLDNNSASLIR
jgi:glucosamine-6-phosphate deaminase